jgi:pyruvate/2-oxoglutarate dehydrogenase complex dihydrolipoamide acyltransferase (E2) component
MSEKLLVPQLNPNDSEVELTHWYVKHGQAVKKGDLLCDFTTSKAGVQHESPGNGFVAIMAPAMKRLRAGTLMALLCATEKEAKEATAKVTEGRETKAPVFSNSAKAKLAELGLKESDFQGHEFVTEKMVTEKPVGTKAGGRSLAKDHEIMMLQVANNSALRSSLSVQLDAAELQKRLDKKELNREGYLAWCVCQALREHPRFLTCFGQEEKNPAMHIAYALDMGAGVRPMLAKDAGGWSAEKWAEQIVDWSLRLMRSEIKLEELHEGNGGFTITDLSSQGILFFEPLLVGTQSAILGIGGDLDAKNPMLTFTLAFDHRVHDGRTGAAFLKTLKKAALHQ